jgi:hypothetical protein
VIKKQGAKPVQSLPARYIDWSQFPNWAAYHRSLSERRAIARRQRRLLERGSVSFEVADEINEVQNLSEWMLRHKETWLSVKGRQSTWVGSKSYEEFLLSIPRKLKKYGYMAAFALLLDGRAIAVQLRKNQRCQQQENSAHKKPPRRGKYLYRFGLAGRSVAALPPR